MRTRRSNKAQEGDSGLDHLLRSLHENDTPTLGGNGTTAPETLADASRHTVGQLLGRVGSKRKKRLGASIGTAIEGLSGGRASQTNTTEVVCGMRARTTQELEQTQQHEGPSTSQPARASACQTSERPEDNDSHVPVEEAFDWEDGDDGAGVRRADDTTPQKGWSGVVTFDADGSPVEDLDKKLKKSPLRRANANDKEFSVQVHMSHLLCVLARGRMVSQSCDDSLLQASLVSLLPPRLLPSAHSDRVTIGRLEHLGSWFQKYFRLLLSDEGSSRLHKEDSEAFETRLPKVLQKQSGSAEELAALSVALFRGLGYVCRYVTVLDVASIKPDVESLEASVDYDPSAPFHHSRVGPFFQLELRQQVAELSRFLSRRGPQVFSSTPSSVDGVQAMTPGDMGSPASGRGQGQSCPGPGRGRGHGKGKNFDEKSPSGNARGKSVDQAGASTPSKKGRRRTSDEKVKHGEGSKTPVLSKGAASSEHAGRSDSKRKGDEEFEAQIAMALAATAAAAAKAEGTPTSEKTKGENSVKGLRKVGTSGSVWSWKMGPLLHWSEVYCGGEGSNGRWVHVDATRGVVDGADQVEGATAACRDPLRYVVAFAGAGAKDVTRRYVNLWSSIEPLRVDSEWWESTMRPLKQLEAAATSGPPVQPPPSVPLHGSPNVVKHPGATANGQEDLPQFTPRSDREDMELDTKLYTEPLPTNQQAYKTHHLYVLERWLKKYETVYPKGPVLGYCSGQPVYRRSSVQTLHTGDRWLREGRKVKPGELPAKIVKSRAIPKQSVGETDSIREESKKEVIMAELFGEWQTEEFQLPRAVGGIVPRNERGQVDVWSEKCLPPGTVHLRFPRLVPVCERLGVDYAPAMVGFEIRRGQSVPVFEGLVICEEFKDAIMEAYQEYEDQRAAQLLKKREEQAATRWRQLFLSVATRKRLRDTYQGDPAEAATFTSNKRLSVEPMAETPAGESAMDNSTDQSVKEKGHAQPSAAGAAEDSAAHVHHYVETSESYDAETGITTKWCQCGSMIQVEEM